MIVYVDSSALLKRVVREPESAPLRAVLAHHDEAGDLLVGSGLCWVEVWRALRRAVPPGDVEGLGALALSGIAEFPLTEAVLLRARSVGPDCLRSLDAVHLASAVGVGAVHLVTYDERLAAAAGLVGMVVHTPG